MTKNTMIEILSTKLQTSKAEAKKFFDAFEETVTETLALNEEVNLSGFVKFSVSEVEQKDGIYNFGDKKGQTYTTPKHNRVSVKVLKTLKDAVNA